MELVQSIGDIFPQVLVEIGDQYKNALRVTRWKRRWCYGEGVVKILLMIY